jgi:hypothetical protein
MTVDCGKSKIFSEFNIGDHWARALKNTQDAVCWRGFLNFTVLSGTDTAQNLTTLSAVTFQYLLFLGSSCNDDDGRNINCCWCSPAQSLFVPSPAGLMIILQCLTAVGPFQYCDYVPSGGTMIYEWRWIEKIWNETLAVKSGVIQQFGRSEDNHGKPKLGYAVPWPRFEPSSPKILFWSVTSEPARLIGQYRQSIYRVSQEVSEIELFQCRVQKLLMRKRYYVLTYLRSWALPEKLPIVQPFRKFPAILRNPKVHHRVGTFFSVQYIFENSTVNIDATLQLVWGNGVLLVCTVK